MNHIFIKNIYHMLTYAFEVLQQNTYQDIETEPFSNIHNLFAAILAKGVSRQGKQGLYRQYMEQKDNLTTLRGKILLAETTKNRLAKKQLLCCGFDELTSNNLPNQVIKSTVMLLLRHGNVDDTWKEILKKELLFFSGVDEISLYAVPWNRMVFDRNNQTYRMLLGICKLVVEGMLLTTDDGTYRLATFIDSQKLHHLYEKFILEYYRRERPNIMVPLSRPHLENLS